MKTKMISAVSALALVFAAFSSMGPSKTEAGPGDQVAGAAGVVAAVVQISDSLNGIYVLNSNFTNVQALNNVLNHSPILSDNNIHNIQVLSYNDVDVTLRNVLTNFLNRPDIDIDIHDVVAIGILDADHIIVFI